MSSGNPDSDLEKAIALSLKESQKSAGGGTSSLYPQMSGMTSSQSAMSSGNSNSMSGSSAMPPSYSSGKQVNICNDSNKDGLLAVACMNE